MTPINGITLGQILTAPPPGWHVLSFDTETKSGVFEYQRQAFRCVEIYTATANCGHIVRICFKRQQYAHEPQGRLVM